MLDQLAAQGILWRNSAKWRANPLGWLDALPHSVSMDGAA